MRRLQNTLMRFFKILIGTKSVSARKVIKVLNPKYSLSKVPEVTLLFWVMKVAATTFGETGGDWISMTLNFGYLVSTCFFAALFAVALSAQLMSKDYKPALYWSVIVATSTAGTTLSDYMNRTLGLGYLWGALILSAILATGFIVWRQSAGQVSFSKISSRRSEIFFWFSVLVSNTLGTALGDFMADDSGLGFLGGWLLVTTILVLLVLLKYFTSVPRALLFWLAFILTRPFGATFGDLLTKTKEQGGFNLGTGYSSFVLLGVLLVALLVEQKNKNLKSAV